MNSNPLDERTELLGVAVRTHRKPSQGETSVPCIVIHETEKALLVRIANQPAGVPAEHWFPLSQIGYIYRKCGYDQINTEYTDLVYVSTWLITKKGIEV